MSATTITPAKPTLSTNDSAVLQALFDAESSPSSGVTIDPTLPQLPTHLNISVKEQTLLQAREKEIIQPLASPSPDSQSAPEMESIRSAIQELDSLIEKNPAYPSAYANRAQTLRILLDSEQQQPSEKESTLSTLLSSLEKAITLLTPLSPTNPVSPYQARLLADTHTHRGYLLLKISRDLKSKSTTTTSTEIPGIPRKLAEAGPDALEEMASRDFFMGGRYGNKVAQQMAVQTNPYAKMCGAIVKEAMRKEVEGGLVG
ncbi:protein hmgX [Aspergillus stella-maris]|uniref:protein hmgX n=1 Tax=Aspergillus stella-maris TaxID=1810926 RepID=UPI003CCD5878